MESILSTSSKSKLDGLCERHEILTKCVQLENMKRDSTKIQREQEKKYNITVDIVDALHDNINAAKEENASLLAEILVGKNKFDRLTQEMEQLKSKFVKCQKELRSFRIEREVRDDADELLDFTKKRCGKLATINKKLHVTLHKQSANPETKVTKVDLGNKLRTTKSSPVKSKRPINAVSIRQKLSPQKISWN